MLRKILLTLAATAMLGGAALTPTTASAHGGFYGHRHGHHFVHHWWGHRYWHSHRFHVGGGDCYYVRRGFLVCPDY